MYTGWVTSTVCAGGNDHVYCIGDVRAGGQACAGGGDHVYCIGDVHGLVDKHVLVAVTMCIV